MRKFNATDLARHTRKILDKVASQRETIAIERNHVLIAKIIPPEQTMTASRALVGFQPTLTPTQAAAWLKDSRQDFDQAIRDPWELSSTVISG